MNNFEKRLITFNPIKTRYEGAEIRFMTDGAMGEFFGYAFQNTVFIKTGLPRRVERFVIKHEKYHLNDRQKCLGWVGSEFRANLVCGIKDPVGLIATIKSSFTKHRLSLYWRLLIHPGKFSQ